MKVTILGGGSFGTALAIHLSKQHDVKVWEYSKERVEKVNFSRINDLLSKVRVPFNVKFYNDIEASLKGVELVLVALPSNVVSQTIDKVKKFIPENVIIVNCSKGFCEETKQPLYKVIQEKLPNKVCVIGGPMHAEEVADACLSGAVIASEDKEIAVKAKHYIQDSDLKLSVSDDPLGVSLGSALKNILAIMIGVIHGLGLGDNTKAYVITKGLEEIKTLGVYLGAKDETFYGLSGLGDIIVTCTSQHSRNRHVGEELGKGKDLNEILGEMTMIAEGVTTSKIVYSLSDLNLPILNGVYDILFNEKKAKDLIFEI